MRLDALMAVNKQVTLGSSWTLVAWCELRRDFRSFRRDRIERLELLARQFVEEPEKTLRDYLLTIEERALDGLDP